MKGKKLPLSKDNPRPFKISLKLPTNSDIHHYQQLDDPSSSDSDSYSSDLSSLSSRSNSSLNDESDDDISEVIPLHSPLPTATSSSSPPPPVIKLKLFQHQHWNDSKDSQRFTSSTNGKLAKSPQDFSASASLSPEIYLPSDSPDRDQYIDVESTEPPPLPLSSFQKRVPPSSNIISSPKKRPINSLSSSHRRLSSRQKKKPKFAPSLPVDAFNDRDFKKSQKDALNHSLEKLITIFMKKDAYAFFLEPVDTSLVTDYLTVIKHPMDFGTMKSKVFEGKYPSLQSFKNDFDLVINNAKAYNAPNTIYFKCAEKIAKYAYGLLEKEKTKIEALEEERKKILEEGSEAEQVQVTGKVDLSKIDSLEFTHLGTRALALPRAWVKRGLLTRVGQDGKHHHHKVGYASDGTLEPVGHQLGPRDILPKEDQFGQIPMLAVISTSKNQAEEAPPPDFIPARFLDYGPFAMLDMSSRLSKEQSSQYYSSYLYHLFGSQMGEAYVHSLQRFVAGMDVKVCEFVEKKSEEVTQGGWSITKNITEMVSLQQDPQSNRGEDGILDSFLQKWHGLNNPSLFP